MPKVLIIESCLINYGDDRGGVHAEQYEQPNPTKDTAAALIASGRALYVDEKDDPSKGKINTASAEMLKAAAAAVKGKGKEVVAPPTTPPAA